MKISNLFISLIVFFSICSHAVYAADDRVLNIEIKGTERIDNETVISYSNISLNDIYTEELGNDALKSLFETDLFSNIEINFKDNSLIITVSENPTVNLIKFEGNKKINDEDLLVEVSLKERSIYSRSRVKKRSWKDAYSLSKRWSFIYRD